MRPRCTLLPAKPRPGALAISKGVSHVHTPAARLQPPQLATSTGPRTPRGRAAVTANALTHGFYSRVVLSDFEDPADYHATLADYLADLRPAGAVEIELVHRYVKDLWKLRRLERLERAFLVDSIEQAERRLDSPIAAQRAFFACSTALHSQFRQYKCETPFERVALLQHRLRRAADTTLRLLLILQAERRADPDAASQPWAEVSTLPPESLAYLADEPPAVCDTIAVESSAAAAPPTPDSSDAPAAPSLDAPGALPNPSDPVDASQVADASSVADTPPAPAALADAGSPAPSAPPAEPPNCPESPETPPASPSIHKPNSTIGFVPPKTELTLPRLPAQRTPKRPSPPAA